MAGFTGQFQQFWPAFAGGRPWKVIYRRNSFIPRNMASQNGWPVMGGGRKGRFDCKIYNSTKVKHQITFNTTIWPELDWVHVSRVLTKHCKVCILIVKTVLWMGKGGDDSDLPVWHSTAFHPVSRAR